MKKFKLCFFDMEGTLLKKNNHFDNGKVAPSAWTLLAKEISDECFFEEEKSKDKWLNGDYISYTDWMRDTVNIHIRYGMQKKHLDKIISQASLNKGAHDLVNFVKSKKLITSIISGGFKELADITQVELKIDHSYSACQYFFKNDGYIEHFNLLPTDEEGKLVFMNHLANEYGVTLKDCIFIGDGKNDVMLAKSCGLSIAFNAQKELKAIASHSVDSKDNDLNEVINILFKYV